MARRKNPAAFEKSRREREKKKKRQEKLDRRHTRPEDEPDPEEAVDGLFPAEMLRDDDPEPEVDADAESPPPEASP